MHKDILWLVGADKVYDYIVEFGICVKTEPKSLWIWSHRIKSKCLINQGKVSMVL